MDHGSNVSWELLVPAQALECHVRATRLDAPASHEPCHAYIVPPSPAPTATFQPTVAPTESRAPTLSPAPTAAPEPRPTWPPAPAPTPRPTPRPTVPHPTQSPTLNLAHGEACDDSTSWYRHRPRRTCDTYVAKKPTKRCKKAGEDDILARDACPDTCGACCDDSESWWRKKQNRGCAWVAKKVQKRCKRKVKDADGAKARVACAATCGTCARVDAGTTLGR